MSSSRLELESVALTTLAAIPLLFTAAIARLPLILFGTAMALTALAIIRGGQRFRMSVRMANVVAAGYLFFFLFDGAVLSRSLIRSSTHLLLFLGVYLVFEKPWSENRGKRVLLAFLIAIASVATSTHLSIVFFLAAFVFLVFRQLIHMSHADTVASAGGSMHEAPSSRPALFYVSVAALMAIVLFPVLPRVRNPLVRGGLAAAGQATSGLSEQIDFRVARRISPNPQVVARIWIPEGSAAAFTPIRLRGSIYDYWSKGVFQSGALPQSDRVALDRGQFAIGKAQGPTATMRVQQVSNGTVKLLLPVGTWAVSGVPSLFEGPRSDLYMVRRIPDLYEAQVSAATLPLGPVTQQPLNYPITPEVRAWARAAAGNASTPRQIAAKLETHMATRFQYVPDPASLGRPITIDDFLLRVRRGHCEYFAAGMVVALASLDVPARIVGGYYGGERNAFTDYFVIRQRDSHAWVEVFDGGRWLTYDPTPIGLRPGSLNEGLLQTYASALSESMNFVWDRYVLTLGFEDQLTLASDLVNLVRGALQHAGTLATVMLVDPTYWMLLGLLLATVVPLFALRKRWRKTPFEKLLRALARLGIEVPPSMTARELMERLKRERPEIAQLARPFVTHYETATFGNKAPSASDQEAAARGLRELSLLPQNP